MNTREITLDEYSDFLAHSHAGYTFLQTPEFARKIGAKVYGGFDGDRLKAAVLIHSRPALKLFRYAYSPYDWVCLDGDMSLTEPFVKSMIATLRHEGFILWQVESCLETAPYDNCGEQIGPEFKVYASYLRTLKKLGFVHNPLAGKAINPLHECVWGSVIDLKPHLDAKNQGRVPLPTTEPTYSLDELLARMKSSKRRAIRQHAQGLIPTVVETYTSETVTDQALRDYATLLATSAEKQHYTCKTEDQAARYLQSAGDHGCLVLVYLPDGSRRIPIAGALFIWTPSEMYYYFAGMDRHYGRYEGPTVIHGHMLEKALALGLERYNLMGVSGDFSPDSPNYGVYKSKKDLGGHIVHYAGVFNLPLRQPAGSLFLRRLL